MPTHFIPPQPWTGRSDPEDGDFAKRIHHFVSDDASRAVLGFASEAGVIRNKGRKGSKEGPAALRKALANMAAPVNAPLFSDLGDVEVEGDDLEAGQAMLAHKISESLDSHDRLVILGGGHETAYGSYCGLTQHFPDKKIGIINLDAHLDLRLVGKNGPSSGTPFTQIRELDPKKFDYLCVGVAEESNTDALVQRADDWGVNMVTDRALIANNQAADGAIEALLERSDVIYLTVCLDVLPQYQAPGVSAPATRGVTLSTIEYLVGHVLSRCSDLGRPLPLADVVELSPPHDINEMTAKTAGLFIRRLLLS